MTIPCPYCEFENTEGADACGQCGQPLTDMHLSDPQSAVERGLLKDRISDLLPKKPICVTSTTPAGEVLKLMNEQGIGCCFVIDGGESIVGVFSERDALLRLGNQASEQWDTPISQFMTPNPESLKESAKIAFAVHQMDLGHYRHLPILDDEEKAVGVISVRDILRYLTSKAFEPSAT